MASAEPDPRPLEALHRQLVARGLRTGIHLEDAQDLAGQTFMNALRSHDEGRGPFRPFCFTVHANLLRNHWRDRKPMIDIDDLPDEPMATGDPFTDLLSHEERETFRALADRILARLDPEEAAFFLTLSDVIADAVRAAVTEAARRMRITPLKGWDIFRRIQRKARADREEFEGVARARPATIRRDEVMAPSVEADFDLVLGDVPHAKPLASVRSARPPRRRRRPDPTIILSAACASASYERFALSIPREDLDRLASLL
jgi:DNA-directed RNA polymerase specialized sigma24 family protein